MANNGDEKHFGFGFRGPIANPFMQQQQQHDNTHMVISSNDDNNNSNNSNNKLTNHTSSFNWSHTFASNDYTSAFAGTGNNGNGTNKNMNGGDMAIVDKEVDVISEAEALLESFEPTKALKLVQAAL